MFDFGRGQTCHSDSITETEQSSTQIFRTGNTASAPTRLTALNLTPGCYVVIAPCQSLQCRLDYTTPYLLGSVYTHTETLTSLYFFTHVAKHVSAQTDGNLIALLDINM